MGVSLRDVDASRLGDHLLLALGSERDLDFRVEIGPVVQVGRPDENDFVPVGVDFWLLVHDQRFGDAAPLGHERIAAPAAAVVAGDGGCDLRVLALGNDLPGHVLAVLGWSHFLVPFHPWFPPWYPSW